MRVLGTNAIFHDPATAPVVDGQVVAAAEAERPVIATRDRILEEGTCASR